MSAAWVLRALAASALVAVAAWCADALLRACGRQRRWAWLAGLLATTALPWAGPLLPLPRLGTWLGGAPSPGAQDWLASMAGGLAPAPASGAASLDTAAAAAAAAWGATSLLLLLALVVSAAVVGRRVVRLRRERVDGMDVRVSPAAGPMVVGWLRPEVVLPEWALAAPAAERALILAHESEHVAARDPLLLAVSGLLVALTPWNPLLWLQRRALRSRLETDCDARVLARGVDRRRYGELLLRTAAGPRPRHAYALALLDPTTLLERRIRAMTDKRRKLRWLEGTLAVAVGGVALLAACDIAGADRASPTEVEPRQADVSKLPDGESAPVIVVDGKVMSAAEVARLDPEKIRRIEVLKGALARLPRDARIAEGSSARAAAERAEVLRRAAAHGVITITTRGAADPVRAEPDASAPSSAARAERERAVTRARQRLAGGEHAAASGSSVPLYVVDGRTLPIGVEPFASGGPAPLYIVDGRTLPTGEKPSIARDRIASVQVLKGAAAAQRYGDAGETGVILITTKK